MLVTYSFLASISIQDLLLHNIRTCQEKNKLLGEKIEKIMLQNLALAQQASSIYDNPSVKQINRLNETSEASK